MERIAEEVARELRRFGAPAAIGALVEAWPAAVGETIARNAWPARVARDGTLHVATSSSAWAFELTQLAGEILARLQEHALEIAPKTMRFAPGPLPEGAAGAAPAAAHAPRTPSAEEWAQAEEVAASIADQDLRALVARAAAASLAKAADDRPF